MDGSLLIPVARPTTRSDPPLAPSSFKSIKKPTVSLDGDALPRIVRQQMQGAYVALDGRSISVQFDLDVAETMHRPLVLGEKVGQRVQEGSRTVSFATNVGRVRVVDAAHEINVSTVGSPRIPVECGGDLPLCTQLRNLGLNVHDQTSIFRIVRVPPGCSTRDKSSGTSLATFWNMS